MNRKTIVTAVAGAVIGGAGVAYVTVGPAANADRALVGGTNGAAAIAQTDPASGTETTTSTPTTTATTDTTAPTGSTATDEQPAERKTLEEILAPLVTNGTITQAQADAVIAAIKDARPAHVPGRGPGRGHPGLRVFFGEKLEVAANAIGITVDELRTALESGQSIAEVATAKGVDVQKVIDALVADANQRIDQAVTNGSLTAAEATELKSDVVERVTDAVNNDGPFMRHGHFPHGGPPMSPPDDDNDDQTPDTTTAPVETTTGS
jgi:hypothetical protein